MLGGGGVDCGVDVVDEGGPFPGRDVLMRLLSTSSSSNFFRLMDREELRRLMRLSSWFCGVCGVCGVDGADIALPPTVKLVVLPSALGVDTLLECLVFMAGVPGALPGAPAEATAAVALVLVFMVDGSRADVLVIIAGTVPDLETGDMSGDCVPFPSLPSCWEDISGLIVGDS